MHFKTGFLLTVLAMAYSTAIAKPLPFQSIPQELETRADTCNTPGTTSLFRFGFCEMKRINLSARSARQSFDASTVWLVIDNLWKSIVQAGTSTDRLQTVANVGDQLMAGNPELKGIAGLIPGGPAANWAEFVQQVGGPDSWDAVLLSARDFAASGKERAYYAVAKSGTNQAIASIQFSIFDGIN